MRELRDASEYHEASYEVDFAAICDSGQKLSELKNSSDYREASELLLVTLNKIITFFFCHGYSKSKTLWGVAYALGHPVTAGMSMLEAARTIGCTKQAISKMATDFLADTNLPPAPSLKSETAKKTYKRTNGNRRTSNKVNA